MGRGRADLGQAGVGVGVGVIRFIRPGETIHEGPSITASSSSFTRCTDGRVFEQDDHPARIDVTPPALRSNRFLVYLDVLVSRAESGWDVVMI